MAGRGSGKTQAVVLNYAGGWSTDFGPVFTGAPEGNALSLPFLSQADNIVYNLDGSPQKVGGGLAINDAVTESGSAVTVHGLFDAWFQGTGGSEIQKRVAYIGTKLMKEDLDGVWDSLKTGLEDNKQPCFTMARDLCITSTTSTVDVPQTYDGSSASSSNLGGSPPNFAFSVNHRGRVWAAGVATNPSRLYYSAFGTIDTWSGGSDPAGAIDIDPDDGDRIVGLASHKRELLVFKGPNKLSIHRITGSGASGADAFARVPFVEGVGGVNHNSIFRVNDDLLFASPRGLHSLAATANYGDYIEAFLSRPILSYYQDELNHSVLNTCWGVNYSARGLAVWTFAKSGGTKKNTMLVYDYRFQPGRWARWDSTDTTTPALFINYVPAHCLAIVQNSARKHRLYAGSADGRVYELDRVARSVINSGISAYTAQVKTPFLNFGSSALLKTMEGAHHSFAPKGDYNMTFGMIRDNHDEQTATIPQDGGGFILDTGELNSSTTGVLGGSLFRTYWTPLEGEFQDVQFRYTQSGTAEDMEPHFAEVRLSIGPTTEENA